MSIVNNSSLPAASLPGIEHRTLAGSGDGLANLSVWRQTMAPGGATPPHRHDCEEVVLVQSGHGRLIMAGVEHEFGPDTTLVIPAGVDHQIFSVGPGPLETIAAFSRAPVPVNRPDGSLLELPWSS